MTSPAAQIGTPRNERMSGWPRGHQPRKRGSAWMSSVRYESKRLEHRAEQAVRLGQRAEARDQLLAHARR